MRRDINCVSPLLEAENVELSSQWFRDVLGFDVLWIAAGAACLSFEGQMIGLLQVEESQPCRTLISRGESRDVDELYDRFTGRRVAFMSHLGRQRAGMRGFTISDPDGNLLIFTQPAEASLRVVEDADGMARESTQTD